MDKKTEGEHVGGVDRMRLKRMGIEWCESSMFVEIGEKRSSDMCARDVRGVFASGEGLDIERVKPLSERLYGDMLKGERVTG